MTPSYLKEAADAMEELQTLAAALRAEARKLASLARRARRDLQSDNLLAAEQRLRQALATQWTQQVEDSVQQAAMRVGAALRYLDEQYDSVFREQCGALHPDWNVVGGAKRYVVTDLIDVEVDFGRRRAMVNGRRMKSPGPLSVIRGVEEEAARLWGGPFDAAKVLQEIREVYENLLIGQSRPRGEYVRLKDVKEAIERRRGEKLDRIGFGALLSRLLRSAMTQSADSWRLHLAPVRSPKDSFPVSAQGGSGREGRGLLRFYREAPW